jgi:acetyl-CoA C-acetyltransferase
MQISAKGLKRNSMQALTDNTPIIVGVGQYVKRLSAETTPPFESPMEIAAEAAKTALDDANIAAQAIDTISVIRLFSDAAKAWASPFGGSNNPPQSLAKHIGASPSARIYSDSGGTEPTRLLVQMCLDIAQGKRSVVLLAGAEAIANQRFAMRNGFEADWNEEHEEPMESQEYRIRFASRQEIKSGMLLPAHYYALIENHQAHAMGNDVAAHRQYMGELMAPFSAVAEQNPFSQNPVSYTPDQLAEVNKGNYLISEPLSKLLVAQDAVNQSAALVLTSVGKAREMGIDPEKWVYLEAYAEGQDRVLSQREDVGRSKAMEEVFAAVFAMANTSCDEMALLDIYSCFPCAVHSACEALGISGDDKRGLTITGGLPYFGGPGNNYVMHSLAEMAARLRGNNEQGLVTANGGILSKHAAVILGTNAERGANINWSSWQPTVIDPQTIAERPVVDAPVSGRIISYTVIAGRESDDVGVVLCEDESGARFLASNSNAATTDAMLSASPIGKEVSVTSEDERNYFEFV